MSGGLWVCRCWSGNATLGAYVGEDGFDDGEVSDLCAAEGWELEPDNEEGLEGKVPWDIVENEAKGEGL